MPVWVRSCRDGRPSRPCSGSCPLTRRQGDTTAGIGGMCRDCRTSRLSGRDGIRKPCWRRDHGHTWSWWHGHPRTRLRSEPGSLPGGCDHPGPILCQQDHAPCQRYGRTPSQSRLHAHWLNPGVANSPHKPSAMRPPSSGRLQRQGAGRKIIHDNGINKPRSPLRRHHFPGSGKSGSAATTSPLFDEVTDW